MMDLQGAVESARNRINAETAKISWRELQHQFACGSTIYVAPLLDLVEVALEISRDNTEVVKEWMQTGQLASVSDKQAQAWTDSDALVWSVVVRPWVLIQNS